MGEILETAEALWKQEINTFDHHPFGRPWGPERVADRTWFVKGFANTIVRETDDGLIMVDPAGYTDTKPKFKTVRSVTQKPLHTVIFTHGHADHVFGVEDYVNEAREKNLPLPRVVAHEAMPARFRRYRASNGWNCHINGRQFLGGGKANFPSEFYFPDITYKDCLENRVGGITAVLRHGRGETDDHTWVFFPDNGILCTGDLFIWAVPNGGNPQKVQRYAEDWAIALREMSALNPETLLPGHGFPIIGQRRVKQALEDTASYLESVFTQTLALMNQGASLDEVIHSVKPPEELSRRAYLQPVYDEPEFIVRNIWRLYGGWYDGTPSHLKPAPEKAQAEEIARLAGGPEELLARARELSGAGDHRLACHLAEWAYGAAPGDKSIGQAAAQVFALRAKAETSTMALGIYMDAARRMGGDPKEALPGRTVLEAQSKRRGKSN